jgi:glutamyl-tRNA reductase
MRVASGLDSMILGEPQILGQLKSAFAVAQHQGTVSGKLHSAFQYVFSVAKRVRSETAIGENPVSVAYAAVALSQRIFSDLSQSKALLIGAGKTIELVARHLQEQGIQQLIIANRTLPRAQELASQVGGEAILLADIPERLHEVDIVISSTASQLPVLGKGAVEQALKRRKHRPMFMVDIAVPRDIESQVAELDDVYLYTVDDLKEVIDENKRTRQEAALDASRIIDEAIEDYLKELRAEDAVLTIKGYRNKAEQLRDEEVEKALKLLRKGDDPEQVIQALARNITNKLLHNPTVQLKKAGSEGRSDVIDLAQQLFEIDNVPTNNK